jgi:putative membrane protein
MSLGMVVFWGGVIWLVWYAVTHAGSGTESSGPTRSPDRILDERFARGEIDADEYRARRDALHSTNGQETTSAGSRR